VRQVLFALVIVLHLSSVAFINYCIYQLLHLSSVVELQECTRLEIACATRPF
jgi:hypothetical protein